MGSYVNAAVTSYTFTVTASVPITANNYIVIKFPTEIVLPTSESTLACSTSYTSIFNSVSCAFNTLQTNSIKVSMNLKSTITQINIL